MELAEALKRKAQERWTGKLFVHVKDGRVLSWQEKQATPRNKGKRLQ